MSTRASPNPATAQDLVGLTPTLRRIVAARAKNPEIAADVVQETLARVWEVRWRLGRDALLGYAIVTARNLLASEERERAIADRNAPRLADPPDGPAPDESVLVAEEHGALATALEGLPADQRQLLLAHEVDDAEARKLAADEGVTPGAIAARLARARAGLRLDYLLAYRRVTLPTERCRPVLLSLSLGDRRRQAALNAGRHLVNCPACAKLADPLVTRRRSLAGLAPVAAILAMPERLVNWIRTSPVRAAVTGTAAVGTVAAVAVAVWPESPPAAPSPPPPPPRSTLVASGTPLLPLPPRPLRTYVGQAAVANGAPVESVPADEGFWIGSNSGQRVWVQLRVRGESRIRIPPGARVSFEGSVVAHASAFAKDVGVTPAEGAAELTRQGAHIQVSADAVEVD